MSDGITWKSIFGRPRGLITVGLAIVGALIVTLLVFQVLPALPADAQNKMLALAILSYVALMGTMLGALRAQAESRQRQAAENVLVEERRQHEGYREQTKKLLNLQEQTLLYAQDLSDAVQRERLRVDELDGLQRVSMAVLSELSLESALGLVAEAAATLTQADTASVSLLTDDDRMRTHVAAYGLAADALQGTSSPADTALHGWVIKSGDPLLVDNLRDTEWRHGRGTFGIRRDGKKTAVVAPLKVRGKVIGCLSAFDKMHNQPFDEHDLQLLSLFANQAAIAIENAQLYEQVQQDLATKSDLVHEIQRRVRESLSLVRDLFSAELTADQSREARETVQAGIRRVQIIAQVYDLLAQHDFGPLGFEELAESIAGLVQVDLDTDDGQHIELEVAAGETLLSPRQATPLALIASELVSEAVARQAAGRIELRARTAEDEITVQIRGYDVGAITDKASRRIIEALVDTNLQGRIHVATEDNTVTILIRFPVEAQPPAPQPPLGIPLDAEIPYASFLDDLGRP